MARRRNGARARRRAPIHVQLPERDEREREEQRYRIYTLDQAGELTCIVATPTLQGIGPTLDRLRKEDQLTNDSRVGIKDDVERKWIINPYAKGDKQ